VLSEGRHVVLHLVSEQIALADLLPRNGLRLLLVGELRHVLQHAAALEGGVVVHDLQLRQNLCGNGLVLLLLLGVIIARREKVGRKHFCLVLAMVCITA